MEASRVCQADKHDKEREALVPRIMTGKKSMRNSRRLRDWVKIPGAITSEKHPPTIKFYVSRDVNHAVPQDYCSGLMLAAESAGKYAELGQRAGLGSCD
ncbi:hypothetical protein Tco_0505601 [Tanacetum coccineum]